MFNDPDKTIMFSVSRLLNVCASVCRGAPRVFFVLALTLAALGGSLFAAPHVARADFVTLNGGAIVKVTNANGVDQCGANLLPRNDDNSSVSVPLGFTANFFGNTHSTVFVNNNGNITFDSPLSAYTPFNLQTTNRQIIAPFFGDVDTRNLGAMPVVYGWGNGLYQGHNAFCIDWVDVGYYNQHADKLNSFQLVLVDRSDTGAGNFDMYFNYDKTQWETGDASGGRGGLGGSCARVGYSNGVNTSFELPGSAQCGSFLDSSASGLKFRSFNSSVPGRLYFPVRNGAAPTGGTISGIVYANSIAPANVVGGAFVAVCGNLGGCSTTLSASDGTFSVGALADDTYNVMVNGPGGSGLSPGQAGPLTILGGNSFTGQTIILHGPQPLPNGTTITSRSNNNGVPVVYWGDAQTLTTHACQNATFAGFQVFHNGAVVRSGPMTEGPLGTYTGTITPPFVTDQTHGDAHVVITITCPDSTNGGTSFDIYIDPSGTVQDDVTNLGIPNASVTLLRSDQSGGPYTALSDNSTFLDPATPLHLETTDSSGHYGWNVAPGFYKVRASAPGYVCPGTLPAGFHCLPDGVTVESSELSIPPAVTNLTLPLHSMGGGGGGGCVGNGCTATPELGSGELFATGLGPIAAVLLYRRRRRRRKTQKTGDIAA